MSLQPAPRPNDVTADKLQAIQDELGRLQINFRDNTAAFWALALAWESVRCAWYIVAQDSREKLPEVIASLADLERFDVNV